MIRKDIMVSADAAEDLDPVVEHLIEDAEVLLDDLPEVCELEFGDRAAGEGEQGELVTAVQDRGPEVARTPGPTTLLGC